MSKKRFPHEYHSGERVEWVRSLPCVVPGCERRPCDNHHTEAGGMGIKAHYSTIVPLCSGFNGHHRMLHLVGVKTFEKLSGIDLKEEARLIEERWSREEVV